MRARFNIMLSGTHMWLQAHHLLLWYAIYYIKPLKSSVTKNPRPFQNGDLSNLNVLITCLEKWILSQNRNFYIQVIFETG